MRSWQTWAVSLAFPFAFLAALAVNTQATSKNTTAVEPISSAGQVTGSSRWIDPSATERGIRVRSERADEWSVTVTDLAEDYPHVQVIMRDPEGNEIERDVELKDATVEGRSRELAAIVALVIEEAPAADPPEPRKTAKSQKPESDDELASERTWWLGGGPRLELGPPRLVTASGGLDARGGMWFGQHFQALADVGWHASRQVASLNAIRVGAGLAAGTSLPARRLWLGGGLMPGLEVVVARGTRVRTTALFATDVFGIAQLRIKQAVLGLRTGITLNLPSAAVANQNVLVWNNARWFIGFSFGWIFAG